MTQNQAKSRREELRREQALRRLVSPLSLQKAVPMDWHRDPPAFAGDPYMDWESVPEPPHESNWGLLTTPH
ncbi:MAG TPA: hypothetical protein VGK74_23305 [Symbiobacteriaceae bacterium]|jgi:hypothetical protein